MFDEKPRKDVLFEWLVAADAFSGSDIPNVGRFSRRTSGALRNEERIRCSTLFDLVRCVEECTRATPRNGRDVLDAAILKSPTYLLEFNSARQLLLKACVQEGLIVSNDAAETRVRAINRAIKRRRRKLGLPKQYFIG